MATQETRTGLFRMAGLAASALVITACAFAQPRIAVEGGASLDLGRMYRGEIRERTITLRNTGTEDLTLGSIEASCGCTGTVLTEKLIPPGRIASVQISFNSKSYNGPIHKAITIVSNDPATPRLMVEFTGTVIVEIVLEPPQFWFRNAEVNRPSASRVCLTNGGTEPLELRGYTTKLHGITVSLPAGAIPPGCTDTLKGVFVPESEASLLIESIVIRTSSRRQPELSIPVYGNVRAFKFE